VGQPFRRREAAVEQEHVHLIERARPDADQRLAGSDRGIAVVLVQDLFGAAVLLEEGSLQNGTSVRSSRTRRAL
jgi:hypothetical protein